MGKDNLHHLYIPGPFRRFSTCAWQNAHVNTVRRECYAMCNFLEWIMSIYKVFFKKRKTNVFILINLFKYLQLITEIMDLCVAKLASKVWKKKCPNFLYTLYEAGRKSDSNATSFFIHSLNRFFFFKKNAYVLLVFFNWVLYMQMSDMVPGKNYNQWKKVLQVSAELQGLGVFSNPNRCFRWQSTLTKSSGFKEDLDCLKTDFNYCSRLQQPKKLM